MNSKSMRVLYPSVSVEFPPIFTCLLLSVYPMSSLLLDILFQLPFPFLVTKCEHRNDEWFSHPFPSVFIPTPRGPYVNMRLMIPVFRVLSYKISSPNTQNTNGTACLNLIMCQKLHPTHKTNNNLTDTGSNSRRGNIAIWLKLERTTNHVKHSIPVSVMDLIRLAVLISDLYF